MTWGNCYVFVAKRWWETRHTPLRGGHIVLMKSRYGWWPHAQWTADFITFEEFHPYKKKRKHWFPPLWFRGYVRVVKRRRR